MRTLARASISLLTAGTLSACSHGSQNESSTRPSTQRADEADRVRLFYRQPSPASADGFYPMSAGGRTTTFTGCARPTRSGTPNTPTQFPGFFLAKEPGCYHLDITEPGSPQTWRANVSLGRAC